MNDYGIDIGNVQPRLNDGRGHQHIDLPVHEIKHDPLQFRFLHLAVGERHIGLRHQVSDGRRHIRNIVDPVIDVVNLSLPGKLPDNGLSDHLLVIFADKGLNRQPVLRRLLQHAHIPYSHQTHVERPWNRCCRQSQHIHIFLQFLDLFLVGHAETLFLVNDQKSKILVFHICGKHAVRADHNIHHTLL